jgi:hypothetical protein
MEPKGETKLDGVTMAMGALDCPICYEPLVPPIYQVDTVHVYMNSIELISEEHQIGKIIISFSLNN